MIITIANQKGGTGKTTTAAAIADGAASRGKNPLAIDLDPQGNLSFIMGGNILDKGSFELLTGQAAAPDLIEDTGRGHIIPASLALATADSALQGRARIYGLRDALTESIKKEYDPIVIDTPPGLGTLLLNALTASDRVLIPVQADILSLQGLFQLADTINQVKENYNPGLEMSGIFFTRHNGRTIVGRELTDTIKEQAAAHGVPALDVCIPEGVAVKESQVKRQGLKETAPNSKQARGYDELLDAIGI